MNEEGHIILCAHSVMVSMASLYATSVRFLNSLLTQFMFTRRIKLQSKADLFDQRAHIEDRDCAKGPCPLPSTPLILSPSHPPFNSRSLPLTLPPSYPPLTLPPPRTKLHTHTRTHNLTKTGSRTHVSHSNSLKFLIS